MAMIETAGPGYCKYIKKSPTSSHGFAFCIQGMEVHESSSALPDLGFEAKSFGHVSVGEEEFQAKPVLSFRQGLTGIVDGMRQGLPVSGVGLFGHGTQDAKDGAQAFIFFSDALLCGLPDSQAQ